MEKPEIVIVRQSIKLAALEPLRFWHKKLIKGVADIEREMIALGGDWHMDANVVLLADGSEQKNVWGFNIRPDNNGDKILEYTSLINIRPALDNREMEIQDKGVRDRIRKLVANLIPELSL